MKEKLISEILKYGNQVPESELRNYKVEWLKIMLELREKNEVIHHENQMENKQI